MALNPCKCGGEPAEQIRGATLDAAAHEVHDGNRDDMRVYCPKCETSTGWNKQHADGAPGAIAEWTRKKWNELNPLKAA